MVNSPEVCVLITDGTNCNVEMAHSFAVAGAVPETVHVNQLRSGEKQLDDFDILALSGGFSYGDDIASGKVLGNELVSYLGDQMQAFVDKDRPIIGNCNGFQVMVRTGLLPNRTLGQQQVTLAENDIGRFECRWVDLAVGQSVCRFVKPEDFAEPLAMQSAHGEGKFFADDETIAKLKANGQVVFRYVNRQMGKATEYPANPNGSIDDIAGICDPKGVILGMMPHPERSFGAFHPDRTKTEAARSAADLLFRNIVQYAKEL